MFLMILEGLHKQKPLKKGLKSVEEPFFEADKHFLSALFDFNWRFQV